MFEKQIVLLKDKNSQTRMLAAEELGDMIEYSNISSKDIGKLADQIINAVCHESEVEIQEALLNTLSILGSLYIGTFASWENIEELLPQLNTQCQEHAITILGFTHNQNFVSTLCVFTNSENEQVRETANDALKELS